MRTFETLLSLANLLTLLALAVPPQHAPRVMRYSALLALVIAGAQALVEGPRWQMVPAYALSGVFFLVWLVLRRGPTGDGTGRTRPNRLRAVLGAGLGALGLAVSIVPPMMLPVFRFPHPSGPDAIGTVTYHWVDAARPEIFTDDPGDHRELMVQIWYPAKADRAAPRAPYVPDAGALAALARLIRLPEFAFGYFKYVKTNAIPTAPAAVGEPPSPVLLFSPGRGGFRQDNTHLIEELVSHGYIVAAIDHPYASSGVVFPDGRSVPLDARLFPGPTGGLPADRKFFDDVVIYLAHDVIFTLDQLTDLNHADPNGILTGRLDLQRAGMLGPSLGGLVGAEACHLEPRLRACLAMDVHMPPDVVRAGLQQPTMFISRDVASMQLEKWSPEYIDEAQRTMRAVYEGLPGDGYLVRVRGTFHANFSDAPLYSPLTSWLGITGPIDRHRSTGIIDAYTLAFFDRHLKGRPAPLLDGRAAQYPEVLFATRRPH